jgi:hypothetical protein
MRHLLCSLLLGAVLTLQAQNARLSGDVVDPSGGLVPNAELRLTNEGTLREFIARSGSQGQFAFPSLAPASYRLQVQAPGFKTLIRSGITLDVQATAKLRLVLEVGSLSDRVDVLADAAPVFTTSPSVEAAVTRDQINTLPLNSRDFNQLVLLATGAVENISSGNGRDFGAVAANGNRSFSNDYTIDGSPNNDMYQGQAALPLSIDMIQEFKVTSGAASAQYGQAGTQITVVTRSGTNTFHGSLFEYLRTEFLQARNPFSRSAPPPFSRHQFGGSLGGPVLLPKLYNGRNKSFFFFNFEGNRQSESLTRVSTVPPDAFWTGDFSSLLSRNILLRDPLLAGRPVIPNNRLDQYLGGARLSPVAAKLKPFWGSPNQPGLTNNLIIDSAASTKIHQFTTRYDQALPKNHQLAVRLSNSRRDAFAPSLTGVGNAGLFTPIVNWNGSITYTAPLSARLLNEARFAVADYNSLTTYGNDGMPSVESVGLRGFTAVSELFPPLPRIQFTGGDAFTQLNYGGTANFGMAALVKQSTTFNYADTLSWTRGKHSLKAGVELRRSVLPALQTTNARGSISFTASNTATAISSGYAFADFIMGIPSSTQQVPVRPELLLRQNEIASYLQDDWRISRRLTFYMGLRHELSFAPKEDKDRITIFDPAVGGIVVASSNGSLPVSEYLPTVVAKLAPNGTFPFPVVAAGAAGLNASRLVNTQYKNFAPRAGFALDLSGKGTTVLRSGYGIFYTRYPIQYLQQTAFVNPPFAGVFNYSQSLQNGRPFLTLDTPYPTTGGNPSVAPAGMERNFRQPSNQQWNLTLEQYLGSKTALSLGYTGNKGTHLFRTIDANGPRLNTAGQVVRPYSATFGTSAIAYRVTNGNSIYHAMLLELRRRAGRGLAFQGNWTWANGIDDTGQTVNNALLDVQNLGRDRARSDYVRRHQFTVNSTYDIPVPRNLAPLAGWRLSGIWRFTTGRYFTPLFTAAGGLSNNRPDVVPGVEANLPRDQRSPLRWFNPAAFAPVPAVDPALGSARFGNAGRNILVGPGLNTMDLSLAKTFRLQDRLSASFRLEAFNAMNHPNYDIPNNNISTTNLVGVISQTVTPARQIQFAFRLDF